MGLWFMVLKNGKSVILSLGQVFAKEEDVKDLPKTFISVNECDPLRDEGINFYRLLRRANVEAQCRVLSGTIHGTDTMVLSCPEVSLETARSIAAFTGD